MADPIINKVEESGLISLDLEKYYPGHPIHVFDLKDYLFMGLILKEKLLLQNIDTINAADYTDKRVVVKGCGDIQIPAAAYVSITNKLRPVAKSIMFGEPCSTVPIYKKK